MAAQIVTQEMVNQAANSLVAASEEPSIRAVQARIGAGSYTTIKGYLDIWRRQQVAPPSVTVPDEIVAKGTEITRALWAAAAAQAERQVQQVREEAQRQVAQAQQALADAEQTIARLERDYEAAQLQAGEAATTADALRSELAEAHSAAHAAEARATTLEQQLVATRGELAEARAIALDHAQQSGELAAMRRQVEQQAQLIASLSRSSQGEAKD